MGYLIILGIFGNDGLIRAIFFDISTPILFLFVSILLTAKINGDPKDILKNLIGFPILWALVLELFLIFSILILSRTRKNIKVVSFVSLMKLISYPILSFIICKY
jgi:predicted permease